MANQKLGQNFLIDKNIAIKIVKSLKPDCPIIIEIGPGKGIMTRLVSEFYNSMEIIAVEKDRRLFEKISECKMSGVQCLNMDILKLDISEITKNKNVTILGNIPYYISKDIIDWTIKNSGFIKKGTLMVQKEFFLKISSFAGSKLYNAQSVIFNHIFYVKKLFEVNPGSFFPSPKVISTVFSFEKKESCINEIQIFRFYELLKTAFAHRRKTLFNNLKNNYKKELILLFLKEKGIQSVIRAEDMNKNDLLGLFLSLHKI